MLLEQQTSFDDINSCGTVTTDDSVRNTKKGCSRLVTFKLYIFSIIVIIFMLAISLLIGLVAYFYHESQLNLDNNGKEYDISIKNVSGFSLVVNKSIPALWKHPLVSDINCEALLNGDDDYIKEESKNVRKFKHLQNTFSTLCEDIKKRGYYPDKPLSQEEADFPLAYIRTIYTDYLTLEYQFLLTYAPQNHYCFIIDKKQSSDFHSKMFSLANCFENVHIISNRYHMDLRGDNINHANYDCMRYLNDKDYKYVIVLNNDDMPLKTNREMVEILKIYNGTIDIQYADPKPFLATRIDLKLDWTLGHLEFFKEGDPRNLDIKILSSNLAFQKGYVQISYPKETVKYLVEELNLTKFLNQLNGMKLYANDEHSFQTLIANEHLNIPGRIDLSCLENDINLYEASYMTRYTRWNLIEKCDKSEIRHQICLQNIKSIHLLKHLPYFYVNKFKAEFDFGGLTCWAEYMYNRTYFEYYQPINKEFYENLPLVKYGKLKSSASNKEQLCNLSRNM